MQREIPFIKRSRHRSRNVQGVAQKTRSWICARERYTSEFFSAGRAEHSAGVLLVRVLMHAPASLLHHAEGRRRLVVLFRTCSPSPTTHGAYHQRCPST